jgi:hypothetical protein
MVIDYLDMIPAAFTSPVFYLRKPSAFYNIAVRVYRSKKHSCSRNGTLYMKLTAFQASVVPITIIVKVSSSYKVQHPVPQVIVTATPIFRGRRIILEEILSASLALTTL